jgi:hypothetical protein
VRLRAPCPQGWYRDADMEECKPADIGWYANADDLNEAGLLIRAYVNNSGSARDRELLSSRLTTELRRSLVNYVRRYLQSGGVS